MSEPKVVRGWVDPWELLVNPFDEILVVGESERQSDDVPVTILRTTPEDVATYRQRIVERLRGPIGTAARREVADDILQALGITEVEG